MRDLTTTQMRELTVTEISEVSGGLTFWQLSAGYVAIVVGANKLGEELGEFAGNVMNALDG